MADNVKPGVIQNWKKTGSFSGKKSWQTLHHGNGMNSPREFRQTSRLLLQQRRKREKSMFLPSFDCLQKPGLFWLCTASPVVMATMHTKSAIP